LWWAARAYVEVGDDAMAAALGRELGAQLGPLRRVDAMLIEGEGRLARGEANAAIEQFEAAQQVIDTWIGRLDLARAYIAAGAFPQATAQLDVLKQRIGEGTSALIDEQPSAYLLRYVYYLEGRALAGVGSAHASEAYRHLLAIGRGDTRDPLALDARARLRP